MTRFTVKNPFLSNIVSTGTINLIQISEEIDRPFFVVYDFDMIQCMSSIQVNKDSTKLLIDISEKTANAIQTRTIKFHKPFRRYRHQNSISNQLHRVDNYIKRGFHCETHNEIIKL